VRKISATDAARHFSRILNRVQYRGESFLVERAGELACEIVPAKPTRVTVDDLRALVDSLPPVDPGYWDAVERASREQPDLPESPWSRS
jgi:antitoxin (DNA-binding transcriptional repressor) of toxin-antitoxin stability system